MIIVIFLNLNLLLYNLAHPLSYIHLCSYIVNDYNSSI